MPAPGAVIADSRLSLQQIGGKHLIRPVYFEFVETHIDEDLDLALLVLPASDELSDHWSFRDLASDRPLKPGHSLVLTGYPADRDFRGFKARIKKQGDLWRRT